MKLFPNESQIEGMTDKEKTQLTEINLGCKDHDTEHTYKLFVTTFLGYGANEAMARHRRDLILSQIENLNANDTFQGLSSSSRIVDPCLPLDYMEKPAVKFDTQKFNVSDEIKSKLEGIGKIYVRGNGDWQQCFESLKFFSKKGEKYSFCNEKESGSCHDEGIKIPPIQFDEAEFYGFSEFWYTMEDVLHMGGHYISTKFQRAAKVRHSRYLLD